MLDKLVSRRKFFKSAMALSALALPISLMAQEAPAPVCPPVKVKVLMSEISNNHGHEFTIALKDLVSGGKVNYSIKGRSGHPHGLQITNDVIVELMQGKTVTLTSSTDAGHSHIVVMQLVEAE
ncbi:MAG: hypothetical protein ABL930_05555 [Pseudobdellovibrio sp.]